MTCRAVWPNCAGWERNVSVVVATRHVFVDEWRCATQRG